VSELSHDTADDGFHEIQLSGKQLVFLFIVTTTVIVVVFLCGVKVGRGARAAQGEEPDQIATSAQPSAPRPAADAGPPAAEAPAPAPETPELTYPKTLQAETTPDSLKPPAESKSKERPKAAKAKDETKAETKAKEAPAPSPAPTAPPRAAPAVPESGVPVSGRQGTWAVQVLATRDRAIASSVVKRLGAKGYPAFLVSPPAGQPFFKVHVGRYNDRAEAEKVSSRIKKEEQFQSWITR
jgi:septal ring-binding cell division protein DamX